MILSAILGIIALLLGIAYLEQPEPYVITLIMFCIVIGIAALCLFLKNILKTDPKIFIIPKDEPLDLSKISQSKRLHK